MASIMISCGEPSGDLYAGALTAEIRRLAPGTDVFGLGGDALRAAGADLVGDYRGLTVTGLVEALRVLPRSWAMYRRLVAMASERRPAVLVVIDFPDFNFRLARAVRALGVPVVYYIPPQIWAWRRGRIRTIKELVSEALLIFPFEADLYREAGVPFAFVGHPLLDLAKPVTPRSELLAGAGLDPAAPTVALLPGSRPNELREILPRLIEGARRLTERLPSVQFLVARAPGLESTLFAPLERYPRLPVATIEARTDDVLAAADVVVTASGTATIQTAIHGKPMVIVYRLSPITYALARRVVSVEAVGMVNLVAGRKVVPELIQDAFNPEAVAFEAYRLLTDPDVAGQVRQALGEVRRKLGETGASTRAAEAVVAVARQRAL